MGSFNGFLDAKFIPPRNWSLDAPLKFKSGLLTKEERELATEASGVLDSATDSRQALEALGTTLAIVNNRLQRAKHEYGEIVEKEKTINRSPISDLPSIKAITPEKAISMSKWLNDPNNKNNKHYERVKKDLADYYMNY